MRGIPVRAWALWALALAAPTAATELPTLMPGTGGVDALRGPAVSGHERREPRSLMPFGEVDVGAWRRGRLYFSGFGPLDYRLSGRRLKGSFHWLGANATATYGWDGEHRLELAWPAAHGVVRLVYADEETGRRLRLEFVYGFDLSALPDGIDSTSATCATPLRASCFVPPRLEP
ncbi:MAG TPA: hypothetical protein VF203_08345 [Burkholderiales bacterium]